MARDKNFLLGRGERLTTTQLIPRGGGDKVPPYDFATAKAKTVARVDRAVAAMAALPRDACPKGLAVAVLTMHPRYISKSDFPEDLLVNAGLSAIGSRLRRIKPENWGTKKPLETGLAEDIFVAGQRQAFVRWRREIESWDAKRPGAVDLQHLEDIFAFQGSQKLFGLPEHEDDTWFEIVLHNFADESIVEAFAAYASRVGMDPLMARRRDVKELTFVPVKGRASAVRALADFSFVRVARAMPALRTMRPEIARSLGTNRLKLPEGPAHDTSFRAVIFDGGIPPTVDLSRWVSEIEPAGIGAPSADYQEHGLAVTSALLFGSVAGSNDLTAPVCPVDHVRVLDEQASQPSLEYIDVLDRIMDFLESHGSEYQFFNISLGPAMPLEDGEVTQWTSRLDDWLSRNAALTTVAAGNAGEYSEDGMNRVQPPGDGVNVLCVGACNSQLPDWSRATYSCVGPGRTPGLVKPDGVAFGGSPGEPFGVLDSRQRLAGITGTSFAAPSVLRAAVAVKAQLGTGLDPLAIRALLIHRAEATFGEATTPREVGWGRFLSHPLELVTCEDCEALVVYQGDLPAGEYLRVPVPMPDEPLDGMVTIRATLAMAPPVDPHHAGAYTRSGVMAIFRPDSRRYSFNDGKQSMHPKSESFFSIRNMYAAGEYELREDGQKWEPCIRSERRKAGSKIHRPCFDIEYHQREAARAATVSQTIRFAMVVSVNAPKVPNLYDRIVRAYANVLVPIQPKLRLPVRL